MRPVRGSGTRRQAAPRAWLAAEDYAAVGRQNLAGHPAAIRPEQPADERRHLFRRPLPAHQGLLRALTPGLVGEPARPELGVRDKTGGDRVGCTAPRAELTRQV